MLYSRNPVFAALLAMAVAVALAMPAGAAWATLRTDASLCGDCCASLPADRECSAASACAPASGQSGLDETSVKPFGAWAIGVLRPALPRAVPSTTWAAIPGSAPGSPPYLSFGRFLL